MLEFRILNDSQCEIREITHSFTDTTTRTFIKQLDDYKFIDEWHSKHYQNYIDDLLDAGWEDHFYVSGDASMRNSGLQRNQ